ncbi:MAG: hypothetical protein WA417_04320 [Stellaceae bacterium]
MTAAAILKLQRAGFTEQQVEALAEFSEAGSATKTDTFRLEAAISQIDNKIDRTRTELELAIEKLRHDLELKIAEGKAETIRWVVGVGFAQVAMILAVLRLFPGIHP